MPLMVSPDVLDEYGDRVMELDERRLRSATDGGRRVEVLDGGAEDRAVHRVLLAAVAERVDRDLHVADVGVLGQGSDGTGAVEQPGAARGTAGHVARQPVVGGAAHGVARGAAPAGAPRGAVGGPRRVSGRSGRSPRTPRRRCWSGRR